MTKELLLELYLQADEVSSEDISLCLYYFSSAYKKFPKSLSHAPLHETPMDYRLLCPWDFPSKNTGVGCHFLLQGIFTTQELNPGLQHCRQSLYCLSHGGSPINIPQQQILEWQLLKLYSHILRWYALLLFSIYHLLELNPTNAEIQLRA